MKRVIVAPPGKRYEIIIEKDSFKQFPRLIESFPSDPLVLITDANVYPLYGRQLSAGLTARGCKVLVQIIPPGESSKTLHQCELLYSALIENHISRDAVIIALGGGVVGDLAGFIAATYLRGIRLIQIPTTLLAQVDSSVGGKVGVNHPLGKNLIGAFYHPDKVLIDPHVLQTLDEREWRAGLAEVVKYAFIQDAELLLHLENEMMTILQRREAETLQQIIASCCQIKADIVQQDERENGVRAWLNFGHTIGHALEAATGYDYYRHGEAVSRGMAGALHLSAALTGLHLDELQRALALIRLLNPPPVPKNITLEEIMARLLQDKKRRRNGQTWVLLKHLGSARLRNDIPEHLTRMAVERACQDPF